jgi:hypothetical protein
VGFAGAEVEDGELRATCDPATGEEVAPGAAVTYTWDGQAWTHVPEASA